MSTAAVWCAGWVACIVVVTYVGVISGLDWMWNWYVHIYVNAVVGDVVDVLAVADMLGFVLAPLVIVGCVLASVFAKEKEKKEWWGKALRAVVYAIVAALVLSTAIKVVAGRESPPHFHTSSGLPRMETWVDNSRAFHFGFMNEQVFGGYPSSHATVYMALTVVLAHVVCSRRKEGALEHRDKIVLWVMYAVAVFISLGVALGHHWLTESVAGMMLGLMIGRVVVRSGVSR